MADNERINEFRNTNLALMTTNDGLTKRVAELETALAAIACASLHLTPRPLRTTAHSSSASDRTPFQSARSSPRLTPA